MIKAVTTLDLQSRTVLFPSTQTGTLGFFFFSLDAEGGKKGLDGETDGLTAGTE